jgi:hypothetical protein
MASAFGLVAGPLPLLRSLAKFTGLLLGTRTIRLILFFVHCWELALFLLLLRHSSILSAMIFGSHELYPLLCEPAGLLSGLTTTRNFWPVSGGRWAKTSPPQAIYSAAPLTHQLG